MMSKVAQKKVFFRLFILSLVAIHLLLVNSVNYAAETEFQNAVVFMYHRFGENKLPSTNIKKDQFIAQLDWLQKDGFQFWPVSKITDYLETGKNMPDKVVAITIDDAYLSVYEVAYPIMRERKIPFTVFISTDHVDKKYRNYMSWDQLREMSNNGMEAGNHSSHHNHLVRVEQNYGEWAEEVRKDIELADRRIKSELGMNSGLFAYPFGEYSLELAELIDEMGYFGFGQHSGAIGSFSDRRFMPRFPMAESFAELDQFIVKAKSLAMPVVKVEPLESVWVQERAPELKVTVDKSLTVRNRMQCFASGQGSVNIEFVTDYTVKIHPEKRFNVRRFRYNCTLPSEQPGRYYWYSHPWINTMFPEL